MLVLNRWAKDISYQLQSWPGRLAAVTYNALITDTTNFIDCTPYVFFSGPWLLLLGFLLAEVLIVGKVSTVSGEDADGGMEHNTGLGGDDCALMDI